MATELEAALQDAKAALSILIGAINRAEHAVAPPAVQGVTPQYPHGARGGTFGNPDAPLPPSEDRDRALVQIMSDVMGDTETFGDAGDH